MELGIVGMGKMGGGLALQAFEKGIKVVGLTRSPLESKGLAAIHEYREFTQQLSKPRKIILYVPAGAVVDQVLDALCQCLEPGNIVMDGGNSYYRDSVNRYERLKQRGIQFLDVGSSGGPIGARTGACFMICGDNETVSQVLPILKQLAVPEGVLHVVAAGAGHFVKLVHNGIEFGMLQAIGEDVALLNDADYSLDMATLFHNWAHGSVIRGWLVELMEKALLESPMRDDVNPYIEDTGEVNWLVSEAVCREIPIPVITQAVWELMQSRDQRKDAHRAVAALRHQFGEHPFGPSQAIRKERREGRLTAIACRS
jgi:6-phosphogluconate dehydrogenase